MFNKKKLHNNVIIAKYMGIQPIKGYNEHSKNEYYYYNNVEMQDYVALPEYTTWNELMPVVERINLRDCVIIHNDECRILPFRQGEFEAIVITKEGYPLLETIYEAVLEYVLWITEKEINTALVKSKGI